MYWNPVKLVICITLGAAIIPDVTALKCVSQSPCFCQLPDGSFYNLSKLSPSSTLNGFLYNYTFSFQPCKDVKMTLGLNRTEITGCNNHTGVSLCALINGEMPFSLGNTAETTWNVPDQGDPQLILIHGNNNTRIDLNCDENSSESVIKLFSVPTAHQYNFIVRSPHVCKKERMPEGISTGSVLVILLFVFSGIYLLVGALALRFFRGAIGWELIPNYDFWSDIPALVRDGIAFTFSGCSVDSYDRI